ncbi:hypothetical protein JW930_03430 [Candidatus Woesearchaeota archaeon]|nr:hypothetical protein [Candidatus Woesearchaeota archaeon]
MNRLKKLTKKEKYLLCAYLGNFVIFILLYFLFSKEMRALFFVTGFILLNIFVSSYKKNIDFPVEIEVLTLGIILCTYSYGIKAGLFVAILGSVLSSIIYGYISPFMLPMILGYILVAIVTPLSQVFNLTLAGIIITLVKNIFLFLFYHFVFSYHLGKNISFSVSNIVLNTLLFFNIAPFLISIMN